MAEQPRSVCVCVCVPDVKSINSLGAKKEAWCSPQTGRMLLILAPKFSPGLTHISCEWYSALVEVGPHRCEGSPAASSHSTPHYQTNFAASGSSAAGFSFCAATACFQADSFERVQGRVHNKCTAVHILKKETVHSTCRISGDRQWTILAAEWRRPEPAGGPRSRWASACHQPVNY